VVLREPVRFRIGIGRGWTLRERAEGSRVAGIRTFALLSLFGALSGLLGILYGGWVIAAALIAFVSLVVIGNLAELKNKEPDSGLTTETAMRVIKVRLPAWRESSRRLCSSLMATRSLPRSSIDVWKSGIPQPFTGLALPASCVRG